MDPYHALGIRRGCTREEAKQAFRARAWQAHPDRGGAEPDFIRLSTAYNQIIAELAGNPSAGTGDNTRSRPSARAAARGSPSRADGRGGSPRPGPEKRPRKPPDPRWKPDLIIAEDRPGRARAPQPLDPDWAPDLVLLDDAPCGAGGGLPPDPSVFTASYHRSLRRLSFLKAQQESFWQSGMARFCGVVLLLGLIAANLLACWIAWNQDSEDAIPRVSTSTSYED
jgi:hypothetical protein